MKAVQLVSAFLVGLLCGSCSAGRDASRGPGLGLQVNHCCVTEWGRSGAGDAGDASQNPAATASGEAPAAWRDAMWQGAGGWAQGRDSWAGGRGPGVMVYKCCVSQDGDPETPASDRVGRPAAGTQAISSACPCNSPSGALSPATPAPDLPVSPPAAAIEQAAWLDRLHAAACTICALFPPSSSLSPPAVCSFSPTTFTLIAPSNSGPAWIPLAPAELTSHHGGRGPLQAAAEARRRRHGDRLEARTHASRARETPGPNP